MSDKRKLLEEIRKRFVGTGEEHDALVELIQSYGEAYDRAYDSAKEDFQEQLNRDNDAVKFAHELSNLAWPVRSFIQREWYGGNLEDIARHMLGVGRTAEQLRQVADAMESVAAGELTA